MEHDIFPPLPIHHHCHRCYIIHSDSSTFFPPKCHFYLIGKLQLRRLLPRLLLLRHTCVRRRRRFSKRGHPSIKKAGKNLFVKVVNTCVRPSLSLSLSLSSSLSNTLNLSLFLTSRFVHFRNLPSPVATPTPTAAKTKRSIIAPKK